MTLSALAAGQSARVTALHPPPGTGTISRLAELGFTEGATVMLVRRAPLGDPLVIRVLNYELCIRASEAACVEVQLESAIAEVHK